MFRTHARTAMAGRIFQSSSLCSPPQYLPSSPLLPQVTDHARPSAVWRRGACDTRSYLSTPGISKSASLFRRRPSLIKGKSGETMTIHEQSLHQITSPDIIPQLRLLRVVFGPFPLGTPDKCAGSFVFSPHQTLSQPALYLLYVPSTF